MKSKRRKGFKSKGFEATPYEMDSKRHGFSLSAPKGVEITDEMRAKALEAAENCSGVHRARINKDDCLIVTFETIRSAARTDENRTNLVKEIPKIVANAMLQEATTAKKRERSAKAAQRSTHKQQARQASYLNRPGPSTSPTL